MRKPTILRELPPKDFIEIELIKNIGYLINPYPYLSFNLICSGIEFLGKCIDDENDFDKRDSENHFNSCIRTYMNKYEKLIGTDYDLYAFLKVRGQVLRFAKFI